MKKQIMAGFLAAVLFLSGSSTAMALEEKPQRTTIISAAKTSPEADLSEYILDKLEKNQFDPEDYSLKVELNKDTLKKTVGKKFTIKAELNYDEYKPKFYSTNKKVAKVSEDGRVRCIKSGKTKIIAECNGVKDICKLSVYKKKKPVKLSNISDSTMAETAAKIGCQTQYAYPESTIMCSAYSFAYAYYQVTGTMKAPGTFWTGGGCNWNGGTYRRLGSSGEMLSAVKAELDKNRACVGLLSTGSSSTHYVTFYGYTGSGTSLSDFKILDPWDGNLTTGAGYSFCSIGYHIAVVNAL